jgi:ABC-type Na+ efflux pump permease subunit
MNSATTGTRHADWRLVTSKEWRDLLGRLGRKPLTRTLGVVVIFGLLIPLRFQTAANLPAFFAVFMAFLPARLVAIDSFAGERERGTLESLLALPLSDGALALGKTMAAALYGAARGWLFVAVWVPATAVLAATGVLPAAAVPAPGLIALTVVASLLVAMVAAVFGVWQSAAAPSVRTISENGGLLRLIVIVTVFFVGPWLLGLLSPSGTAPTIALPGGGRTVSLAAVMATAADNPAGIAAVASVIALGVVAGAVLLTRDLRRRCRREELAMVGAN